MLYYALEYDFAFRHSRYVKGFLAEGQIISLTIVHACAVSSLDNYDNSHLFLL